MIGHIERLRRPGGGLSASPHAFHPVALLVAYLLALSIACCPHPAAAQIPASIHACSRGETDGELPPLAFYQRVDGRVTAATTGYSVDFLRLIVRTQGIEAKVDMIPWKRCLAEVDRGGYELLLDAAANEEREKKYLISKPYYTLQDAYLYLRSRPVGKVESAVDLRRLRVCGQAGYTYRNWGLEDAEIDTGARTFEQALQKLRLGRCDVVLIRLETARGNRISEGVEGIHIEDFAWKKMPGMVPLPFHMMVSRNLPYSQKLLALIDAGIERMIRTGEAKKLEGQYLAH
jgi:polar amino acid transport system substrate-binding protein